MSIWYIAPRISASEVFVNPQGFIIISDVAFSMHKTRGFVRVGDFRYEPIGIFVSEVDVNSNGFVGIPDVAFSIHMTHGFVGVGDFRYEPQRGFGVGRRCKFQWIRDHFGRCVLRS